MIGLALVHPSNVHSYESPRRTNNGEHARNEIYLNINNYCGKDWTDAYNTCWMSCPNGKDSECSTLGEDYSCQSFTLCDERIKNGLIFPKAPVIGNGGTSATDAPSKQPIPSPTAKPVGQTASTEAVLIAFPSCPEEYSSGADYTLGSLVAYLVPGSSLKGVFECQGENCNAGQGYAPGWDNANLTWEIVGSCDHSTATAVEPTQGSVATEAASEAAIFSTAATEPTQGSSISTVASAAKWFPEYVEGSSPACAPWLTDAELGEEFLFESQEDCCVAYPKVGCIATNATAPIATSSPGLTPGQQTESPGMNTELDAPTEIPTAAPTEADEDTYDTYMPTSSALFIHGQSLVFGIATLFIALLF